MKEKRLLYFYILIVGLTLVISLIGFYQYRDFYHDDAFISLRYSSNLIRGDGLVWNTFEKVEGYSNFLQIILISFLGWIGIDLVIASKIIGVLSFVFLNLFVYLFCRRFLSWQYSKASILPAPFIFVTASFPLIIWSLGGLEGVLFTLFCTVGIWLFSETVNSKLHYAVICGICYALMTMIRPEGLLFFVLSGLFSFYLIVRAKERDFRFLLWFVIAFLCFYGPYYLWRFNYYGLPFPNTFYVKGDFELGKIRTGCIYLLNYIASPPYLFPVLFFSLFFTMIKRHWNNKMSYLSIILFFYLIYVVYLGGDHMPAFRFILPIIPILSLLLYFALEPLNENLTIQGTVIINSLALLLVMIQIFLPSEKLSAAKDMDSAAFVGSIIGKYISNRWPSGTLIALNTAGSTPYYASSHRFVDMLGLNDNHIARREIKEKVLERQNLPGHEKGDGQYVLSRKPDYIIVGPAYGTNIDNPWFLSDLEMQQSPQFLRNYQKELDVIPVSHITGYGNYFATRFGEMIFTYYKRKK